MLKRIAPIANRLRSLAPRRQAQAPKSPRVRRLSVPAALVAEDRLNIPVNERALEECEADLIRERGRFLVRQERWGDLAHAMRQAEAQRDSTQGGLPSVDLLAFGARADVVESVEQALTSESADDENLLLDGVMGFEAALQDHQGDPMIALVVALTHIDLGWAWRGQGWPEATPPRHERRANAHFDRARTLLSRQCGATLQSPALLAAGCAARAGGSDGALAVADEYETLIDLAPENPRHMRALGNHMLPRWFGSYGALELEARRTAVRTQFMWGAGGYAWVYFDAIVLDAGACARVDVPFFLDGLRDILRARPDQEMVNLLTAFCCVALPGGAGGNDPGRDNRARIAAAADWLIRDHLTEIHPLIWAHASDRFVNNLHVRSSRQFASRGRADALRCLSALFADEIRQGQRVTFTPDGLRLEAL
ncbi:hypothetical protein M3P21_10820 [Ruegeria sp. 2012CJ41-6]|uniref:Uncharacterized protein n=1 Tax=Ruegeria spongiae TaxID=2942209 RepID=A0ABT0Q4B8_9RHOB|nr:hypothetical protein [Ruegeria spongiae]MCL6284023.1 hypothetical protein [Ruegeria spongiae]